MTNKEKALEIIENSHVTEFTDLLKEAMKSEIKDNSCYWEWIQSPIPSSWSEIPDDVECGWRCSACLTFPDHDNYIADDYEHKPDLKYCPNCGRKVVEE